MSPDRNQEPEGAPFDSPTGFQYIRGVIIGFFRLIFYAVVAYVIYKFVMFVLAPRRRQRTGARTGGQSGVMVKDEVCNTYLPREDAVLELGRRRHHLARDRHVVRGRQLSLKRGAFLAQRKGGTAGAGRART